MYDMCVYVCECVAAQVDAFYLPSNKPRHKFCIFSGGLGASSSMCAISGGSRKSEVFWGLPSFLC